MKKRGQHINTRGPNTQRPIQRSGLVYLKNPFKKPFKKPVGFLNTVDPRHNKSLGPDFFPSYLFTCKGTRYDEYDERNSRSQAIRYNGDPL